MKDHLKHHVKHMVIGAAVVLVALIALGVNLGEALMWAVLLACPVGLAPVLMLASHPPHHPDHADGARQQHGPHERLTQVDPQGDQGHEDHCGTDDHVLDVMLEMVLHDVPFVETTSASSSSRRSIR